MIETGGGVAKCVIFPSTSGEQHRQPRFSLNGLIVSFSADLEAREREAQSHESEEEETRITRSLEQEVMINSYIPLLLLRRTAEVLYDRNENRGRRCSKSLSISPAFCISGLYEREACRRDLAVVWQICQSRGFIFICPFAQQQLTAANG